MRAVVLVGGVGMRLRPLTESLPKPVIELVDRPAISFLIEWLGRHGVEEVILACGFLPDELREGLGEGGSDGPRLRYVVEPEPLGTGGAIRHAAEGIRERLLALNGDCLTDLDLGELIARHEAASAKATLGLYAVGDPSGFGLVRRGSDGWITEFLEKPEEGSSDEESPAEREVNAGMYVLEPEFLDSIPVGEKVSIERDVFPAWIGHGLQGVRLEGYWQDIGTPDRYRQATWDILEGRVETSVPKRPDAVYISPSAEISGRGSPAAPEIGPRVVIGPRVKIESGARVSSSIIQEDCEIQPGAVITESILAPRVTVERGANVYGAVIGPDEWIEA